MKIRQRALSLLLSMALVLTFMPALTMTAWADMDNWWWYDDNTKNVYLDKDETGAVLSVNEMIEFAEGCTADTEGLTYQWLDEEGDYINGATDSTYEVYVQPGGYAEYRCRVIDGNDDDYKTAWFYVYGYQLEAVSMTYTPAGTNGIREFNDGYFRRDEITDSQGHYIDDTDYYWYYDTDEDYGAYSGFFNAGDKITMKYEDNSTVVYTAKGNDEDGVRFYDNNGNSIWPYAYPQFGEQSFDKHYSAGDRVNCEVWCNSVSTVMTAQIVKNPNAAYKDGMLFRKDSEISAYIDKFYDANAVNVVIPSTVTLGDGKTYSVREISSYAFEENHKMKSIKVPSDVYSIGNRAFGFEYVDDENTGTSKYEKISGFTVYAQTNSAAYTWAKANGLTVIDNDSSTNGTDTANAKAEAANAKTEAANAKTEAANAKADTAKAKADAAKAQQNLAVANTNLATAQKNYNTLKSSSDATAAELKAAKAKLVKAQNEVKKLKAKARTVKKVKAKAAKKGRVALSWKKTTGAKGYQIYRSNKKTSGFKKVATVKKSSIKKWTDKKSKKGKTYYYKIRPYNKVAGKTVTGKWSSVVKVKTKKK